MSLFVGGQVLADPNASMRIRREVKTHQRGNSAS